MTTYKNAGVDKEEGYKTVEKIKDLVKKTHNSHVLNGLGSFGAFFSMPKYKNPILVSGTDGVGTKIKLAIDSNQFGTIGQDCFAMCSNDILCHGAKPLFFLDYLACGSLNSETAKEIISGITKACEFTGCALIGGETAEMPDVYKKGDYDVAGFCVGAVEKDAIIDGSNIKEDDIILGLESSGFHSNGYSLIRKIFTNLDEKISDKIVLDSLLEPTRLYHKIIFDLIDKTQINGIAHITGGGLIENLPRILSNNLDAVIDKSKVDVPEIMKELQKRGNIKENEMWGTFNMGVGMVIIISPENISHAKRILNNLDEPYHEIGFVKKGNKKIKWA